MNVASAGQNDACIDRKDSSIREAFSENFCSHGVVFIAEPGKKDTVIGKVKIDITGGKAFAGFPLVFASFKIIAEKIFFCNTDGMLWNGQLVNHKASSLRVNGMGEKIKSGPASGILRIVFVICPGKKHFSWLYKAAHIINMAVGFIVVNTKRQPDDFFNRKILTQLFFNFRSCKRRIAPRTQQTFFGRKQGSFSINMDGTAFQNKGAGIIEGISEKTADSFRNLTVMLKVGIQTVILAAPGVEFPLNASSDALIVDHKRSAGISCPGILCRGFNQMNPVGGKQFLCRCFILWPDEKINLLISGNCFCNFCKCRSCRFCPVIPRTGAPRPDHQCAFVGLKFARHVKAIGFWGSKTIGF